MTFFFLHFRALHLAIIPAILVLASCSPPGEHDARGAMVIGEAGRQPGQFSKPRAVAVTSADEIVAIDRTGRVQLYDVETGAFIRQWRLPAWEGGTPTGMSIDPTDDSIWIADTHYYRILHYSHEGELLTMFGEEGEGPGQLVFPTDVTPDPDGKTVWITEYGRRNRVMQFTRNGEFIQEWGSKLFESVELARPMAISVSPDGDSLYVVDSVNHRINVYDREGNVRYRFGEIGTERGKMKYPLDLAVAPDGTLYIVEYENSRVSHFTPQGSYLGSWGTPGRKAGELAFPWGCAVGPGGELVLADTNNMRLQVVHDPERWFDAPKMTAQAGAP